MVNYIIRSVNMNLEKKWRTQSVYENLFKTVVTKAQNQQLRIIEAAIQSFVTGGIQDTSYASIAKSCRISRPLIHHYFPDWSDLIRAAGVYVRSVMQDHAVKATQSAGPKAVDQLEAYIESCFTWIEKYPVHFKFWLLYFYQCGIDAKVRSEHTELVQMGHQRITALLRLGNERGEWKVKDLVRAAKMIQTSITGNMMVAMTENSDYSLRELNKFVFSQALLIVGRPRGL
jgi:AcrR family transcriptional regulator